MGGISKDFCSGSSPVAELCNLCKISLAPPDLNFLRKIRWLEPVTSKIIFSYFSCCSDAPGFEGGEKIPSLGQCMASLNEETKQMT